MITPHDIPGYTQGFRFSDAPDFYDGSGRFYDLSPYARWGNQDCTLNIGTPTFETIAGKRALRLDNTSHWEFLLSATWEGTMLAVVKPTCTATTTISRGLVTFGTAAILGNRHGLTVGHFSTGRRLTIVSGKGTTNVILSKNNDDLRVGMFGVSQEARKAYASEGLTITESAANADLTTGVTSFDAYDSSLPKCLLGCLTTNNADVTAMPDLFAHMFELHLWNTPVLKEYPEQALALIAAKRQEYGLV